MYAALLARKANALKAGGVRRLGGEDGGFGKGVQDPGAGGRWGQGPGAGGGQEAGDRNNAFKMAQNNHQVQEICQLTTYGN